MHLKMRKIDYIIMHLYYRISLVRCGGVEDRSKESVNILIHIKDYKMLAL